MWSPRKVFTQKARVCCPHHWALPGSSCVLATSHLIDYNGKSVTFWYKEALTSEKIVVHECALFLSRKWCHISHPRDCKWCVMSVRGLAVSRAVGMSAVLLLSQMRYWKRSVLKFLYPRSTPGLRSPFPHKWRDSIIRNAAGAGREASFGYDPLSRSCSTGSVSQLWLYNGTCGDLGVKKRIRLDETPIRNSPDISCALRVTESCLGCFERCCDIPQAARAIAACINSFRSSGIILNMGYVLHTFPPLACSVLRTDDLVRHYPFPGFRILRVSFALVLADSLK